MMIERQKRKYNWILLLTATYGGFGIPWVIGFPRARYTPLILACMIPADVCFMGRFGHKFYENQQLEVSAAN